MPRFDLNLSEALASEGLEFINRKDDGSAIVRDVETGQEGDFDVSGFIHANGFSPADVDIEYNTAEKPIQESPVSIVDRFKVGFGNEKGKAKFLREKFQDVATNENGEFVVKDKGAWHRVDPEYLGGDPWNFAKELAAEVGENISTGVSIGGTSLGAAAGGIVGSAAPGAGTAAGGILGAGIGGGGAKALNNSLGKIMGTYDATPGEEMVDIGLDALFSMGGQAVALGARPAFESFSQAMKNIARTTTETGKNLLATTFGKLTNVGETAMATHLDNPSTVTNVIEKTVQKFGKNIEGGQQALKQKQLAAGRLLMTKATKALPREFRKAVEETVKLADDFAADLGGLSDDAVASLENQGIGRMVTKAAEYADEATTTLDGAGRQIVQRRMVKPGQKTFQFYTEAEATEIAQTTGRVVEVLTAEERAVIAPLVHQIQTFGSAGVVKGKEAVRLLVNFERLLNNSARKSFDAQKPGLNRVVTAATDGWRKGLNKTMDANGLAQQWSVGSKLYRDNGNIVREARRLLEQDVEKGLETLVTQLASSGGKNAATKGGIDQLIKLVGPTGEMLKKSILVNHAAEKFYSNVPRLGLWQGVGLGSGITAVATGGLTPALAVPAGTAVLAASTPRLVSRGIRANDQAAKAVLPYMVKGAQMLRQLPPPAMKQFLKNDQAMQFWLRSLTQAMDAEDQIKDQIGSGLGVRIK